MGYLIETDILGFRYWVKYLDKHYVRWRLEGLKGNATEFTDHAEAERQMDVLKIESDLKVVKR